MRYFLSVLALLLAAPAFAQPAPPDSRMLLPVPVQANWGTSRFSVKSDFTWQVFTPTQTAATQAADSAVAEAVERLVLPVLLPGRAGAASRRRASPLPTAALVLQYGRPGNLLTVGDDESYTLRVTPMGVALNAGTHLGILRGLATLRQLAQAERKTVTLPEVDITDAPRFSWRGLLVDGARHFMPLPVLKRNLDGMWATKLNVLHWHLSDDQGFRVESKLFPRLHQVGGQGQYYTQQQIREVVRYAGRRGIRVVPELDMPGHATSWLAAYPRLASNDSTYGVATRWGVLNIAMDPTRETTYSFIDSLLSEVTPLFPDAYFHVGGDENDGRQWRRNPRIVAYMKQQGYVTEKGLPDKHALQMAFNRRVLAMVTKYNKKMVGWDEILGPGLPTEAVIQSWRGKKGLYDAAKAGHQTILSNGYYIDLYLSAASHYAPDPLPQDAPLTPEQQKLILGGEATMWAEFADSLIVDYRIWPRAAAVAERLWSPAQVRDVPDMYRRLALLSPQLETLGLQHRQFQPRLLLQLAGSPAAVPPLRALAQVLEPVKEYKRHFQGFKYSTQTPFNRLVDAAPAESEVAREFGRATDKLLEYSRSTPAATRFRDASGRQQLGTLREQLQLWQNNDALVQPTLQQNPLLKEYAPLSGNLKAAATLGLERLTMLEKGQVPPPAWQAAAMKQLDALKAPAGQTELAILPHLRRLVEAK